MAGLPSTVPVRRLPRNRTKSTNLAGDSSNTAEELDRAVQKLQQEVSAVLPNRVQMPFTCCTTSWCLDNVYIPHT